MTFVSQIQTDTNLAPEGLDWDTLWWLSCRGLLGPVLFWSNLKKERARGFVMKSRGSRPTPQAARLPTHQLQCLSCSTAGTEVGGLSLASSSERGHETWG